ncbi:MAG TPA: hypothetical protein VLJ13_05330 [Brevundimonas sp.]|nr:hypothetical protein [Brevundimonas sp.]
MRVLIVSAILGGGMLALGACATAVTPTTLSLAEQTERCPGIGSRAVATGRQTGNLRQDYRCESTFSRPDSSSRSATNAAVDRSMRRGL